MKKMFSQMFRFSFVNQALRLVLVVIILSYAANAAAKGEWNAAVSLTAKVKLEGSGSVYVSKDDTEPESYSGSESSAKETKNNIAEDSSFDYSLYAFAKPATGFYFSKWDDGTLTPRYALVGNITKGGNFDKTITAEFNYIIDLNKTSVEMMVAPDQVYTAEVSAILYKSTSLTVSLEGEYADYYGIKKANQTSYAKTLTFDASDGLGAESTPTVTITIAYTSTDLENALDKTVTLKFVTDNHAEGRTVSVVMKEAPKFTFLPSGIDGCTYKVEYADNNVSATNVPAIGNAVEKSVISDGMKTVTLTAAATAASNYKFFGWQTIDANGVGTYFSYENPCKEAKFDNTTTFKPIFVPKDQAEFIIKEDPNNKYLDLQEALDIAKANNYATVVFNAPTKGTIGTLSPRKNADGTIIPYEVPAGVTLLIPGDAAYTCKNDKLAEADYAESYSKPTAGAYAKLIMEDGVQLNVKGVLNVHGLPCAAMGSNGSVNAFGQIHLQGNASVTMQSSSKLYAYGYITGESSTNVTIDEGAYLYELFQFTDWRGGTAASKVVGNANKYKVFPIAQYYAQNVEAPLTLIHGATQRVMTAVRVDFLGTKTYAADIPLVVSGESGGMFCLTDGTMLKRTYDSQTDYVTYEIIGQGLDTKVFLSDISMSMYITVNSSDYVLPINNNIHVIAKNITLDSKYDVSLLPGSSVTINDDAKLLISEGNFYVMDGYDRLVTQKESRVGYFGSGPKVLAPLPYSPTRPSTVNRALTDESHAQLIVNGSVEIAQGAQLITTSDGSSIISTKDGAIVDDQNQQSFNAGTLYQAPQVGSDVSYIAISTTPAKLRNSDGTYVETSKVYPGTYTYYITDESTKDGVWSLPPAKVKADSWNGNTVTATMPKQVYPMTITCAVENVTADNLKTAFTGSLVGTGFAFAGTDRKFENSISLDGNTLSIAVNYTPQNNTSTQHTATLTLINATVSSEEYTFSTTLTATEVYSPEFEINPTEVTLPKTNPGVQSSKSDAFTITPTSGTVATLTKEDGLTWSYTLDAPFAYRGIVDGILYNENNNVTFNAATSGTHTKTLTITATYKPANGGDPVSVSKEVTLIGTSLTPNTLAFDMPSEIKVTGQKIPVKFTGQNNMSNITVTIDNASVAGLVKNPDDSYVINALSAGTFILTATQEDAGTFAGTTTTCQITVTKLTPNPTWNWGVVYGNQEYTLPFDPSTVVEGEWTLKKTTDEKNLLEYDADSKTLKVHNINVQSSASFVFKQKETHDYAATPEEGIVLNTTINTDPRILPFTITDDAQYEIIETKSSEGAGSYLGNVTIPANAYIILQFVGIPNEFSFTTNAEIIELEVSESINAQDGTWSILQKNENQYVWKFSTYSQSQYIKIYNNGTTDVVISNVSISSYEAERKVYYAKVVAESNPSGVGQVAVVGSWSGLSDDESMKTPFIQKNYASTWSGYAYVGADYLAAMGNGNMIFDLYAKATTNGYYFTSWTPLGHYLGNPGAGNAPSNEEYKKQIVLNNVTDMYFGYDYPIYQTMYKYTYPEHFNPETDEPLDPVLVNAATLTLIPATHVGTWQANFALAEVVSVSAEVAVWNEVTSPNASDVAKHPVEFNILGDDVNDFVATLKDNDGFSFTENDITLSAVKTYTIEASYTPQDVHGTHTAMLTLARVAVEGVTDESKKTITLTATENLTPDFTLADANFGDGTLGQETIIDILPADKNTVAQVADPTKLAWTASLSENAPFNIVSIAEDGTCKVRYFRTESGAKSATLTITATYTDSKGTQIPFATTCTLSGSSSAEKAANTLALVHDIVLYVDDEPISPFSVNDANNKAPITITLPDGCTALQVEGGKIKPSGDFTTGDFTITVSQEENAYFQASGTLTTKVTVKKHTPEVTWNWTDLYFGQTYTTPVTTNSDGTRTITPTSGNTNLVHYVSATETVTVDPLSEGEYPVVFSVKIAESNTFEAYSQAYTATLYKDPRHVRVDVNSELTYRSVTIAKQTGKNVSFRNGGIHFADVAESEPTSRQWTMYFIGVPDQLFFTPSGNNAWEIRESSNGVLWETTFASSKLPAGEQFAMSLSPNTTHVRIVYATNADAPSNGVLNSFYITALQGVKANVDGLYMPIAANVETSPTTKQVVLQYTSQEKLTISTGDPQFTVDVAELPALNVDKYAEQTVVVTSKATQEKEGRIYVKNAAGDILLELPIYTFIFPQTLPIQLATDEPQRFYYVTTASNYVKWDKTTRVVTLQNAPANTTRSLTFAFDGAPTLLRFNHTAGDRGTRTVWESANNTDWYGAEPATRVVNGNEIEQGLLNTTRYVRLEYTSPYSEKVEVSNLIIVGDASVTTDVNVLEFTETQPTSTLNVTAINLADFAVQIGNENFTASFDKTALTDNGIVEVPVSITWAATTAVEYATLTIVNPNDDNAVLATVELVGKKQSISGPTNIGIYTGLAENITKLNGTFEGTERRPVDLTNAFDADTQTKALFDYLLIYGETSTMDGSTIITTPTNQRGSNAKTPCYIYQREGDTYKLLKVVDNVNDQDKAWSGAIAVPVSDIPTRVYITGFAPYASTGYTKEEEGVWCFRGQAGSKLDVYLEDSYIYSRYKTIDGHSFIDRDNGESFAEQYARGSGGVLVFECSSVGNKDNPFEVNIHTMDRNLLKSHYGCFLSSIVGRAFQVSSPIQVHLISTDITAATHLSFDDIWPTAITRTTTDGVVTAEEVSTKRTNGFISLQKQVNNAPSIDLGSPETVVNFNGGQVELQNAQNVSDNYKTTLAISYRGGKFAGYFLAHGVGSDEVTGTVNFNDGTTTVIPMTVDERYRQYYLMDEDEDGNELNITSCLRCPQNTYVYGGSHCMMRACNEPTSKGGAPWSHAGEGAVRLGMYKYPYKSYTTGEGNDVVTHAGGWTVIEGGNGLVSIPVDYIPNIKVGDQVARQYGVASVMPNDNGTPDVADDYLNFWVPAGYDDSVTPEVDLKVSYWKAAMTKIKAEYASYGGEVGGNIQIGDDTEVETELVYNLLYCVLDNDIRQVISAKEIIDGKEVYKYAAPVKHPAAAGYLEVRPSEVGTDPANYVENQNPYEVQNRVYYITPIASADNWMTFTAPFDVENIYVVETYDEKVLATQGSKAEIKIKQAEHNADFAAFFGVALALGSDRDFEDIYANYIGWAKLQDVGKYTGQYNLRGKHELEYYDGTNWSTANYYLYENQGTWTINADGVFTTQWTLPDVSDEILMNKGETYSLLFPYCTGCWEYDEDGNFIERTMWDYWSGKFVIFESTLRSEENPHVIDGVNTAQAYVETHTPAPSEAYVLGNTSFGDLRITNEHLYQYVSKDPLYEEFKPVGNVSTAIQPTSSFLLANITAPAGQKITGIRRTGEIIYDKHGTSDVGHIPTVGGGHDLFITSIEGGINVAVAAPQYVRVLSSTGSVIYSGMIQTALDIQLPSLGMYVVSGEKEVQKVMY